MVKKNLPTKRCMEPKENGLDNKKRSDMRSQLAEGRVVALSLLKIMKNSMLLVSTPVDKWHTMLE